jgi:poly(3-hydroxybutyrate) depolymerase
LTDSGLAASTTYSYTVRAVNNAGAGPASTSIVATTTTGFACVTTTSNNYEHVQHNRAYTKLGYTYANGSNDSMGLYNILIYTTLAEVAPNYYVVGSCPDSAPPTSSNTLPSSFSNNKINIA